jgi:hypothetical protein
MPFVFGSHSAEYHYAHNKEKYEKHDGNDENWHASPLSPFWNEPTP